MSLPDDLKNLIDQTAVTIPCPEHGLREPLCDCRAIMVRDVLEVLARHEASTGDARERVRAALLPNFSPFTSRLELVPVGSSGYFSPSGSAAIRVEDGWSFCGQRRDPGPADVTFTCHHGPMKEEAQIDAILAANPGENPLAQLQVQAPVGEHLENGGGDEREGIAELALRFADEVDDNDDPDCPHIGRNCDRVLNAWDTGEDFTTDDLRKLAAGYGLRQVPDVEAVWRAHLPTVAPYHVDPQAEYDANAVARGVAYETGFRDAFAAVLALMKGETTP